MIKTKEIKQIANILLYLFLFMSAFYFIAHSWILAFVKWARF